MTRHYKMSVLIPAQVVCNRVLPKYRQGIDYTKVLRAGETFTEIQTNSFNLVLELSIGLSESFFAEDK